jgi:hypothetical protein
MLLDEPLKPHLPLLREPLRSKFDVTAAWQCHTFYSAANAIASFQNLHLQSTLAKDSRGCQARWTSPNDDNVVYSGHI